MNNKKKIFLTTTTILLTIIYIFLSTSTSSITTPLTGASTTSTTSSTTHTSKTNIPSYIEDTGNISIYFCPHQACEEAFTTALNLAQVSLDCALYDINLNSTKEILDNKAKTIPVRIITDDTNLKKYNRTFVKHDKSGLMHDKFCIIDNHITTTGSMNPTFNDAHLNNNNLLIIHSQKISKNYEDEFQEMWNGIFKKGNLTLNPSIKIQNTLIQTYFCPEEDCAQKVRTELKQSTTEIYFMTFSFTNKEIANILLLKNLDNLTIRGIMERTQIDKDSAYINLHNNSIPLLIDKNPHNLHHKVFIIDNTTIITGSFNPTKNGNEHNDENILIIKDKTIAKQYLQEFDYLWNLWTNQPTTQKTEPIENSTTETITNNRIENDSEENTTEQINFIEELNLTEEPNNIEKINLTKEQNTSETT